MNTELEYEQELIKIMHQTFINYKGNLVECLIAGFRFQNKKYNSLQEIDEKINEINEVIKKSIT